MKFLENMVPEGTPGATTLTWHLHKHLAKADLARPLGRTHASDVTKEGWCPRRIALLLQHGMDAKPGWATAVDRLVWALGRATEDIITDWTAEMGMLVGDWSCVHCGTVQYFTTKPLVCSDCQSYGDSPRFIYEEVRFTSEKSGISSGIDVLLRLPPRSKLVVTEIKSIKQDQFKALKAPLAEHNVRTNLYLRSIEESPHAWKNMVDTQNAIILYVCKQGWGVKDESVTAMGFGEKPFAPFREFEVSRNDKVTDEIVELAALLEEWKKEVKATNNLKLPAPKGICPTMMCPRAQKCEVRNQCFSV